MVTAFTPGGKAVPLETYPTAPLVFPTYTSTSSSDAFTVGGFVEPAREAICLPQYCTTAMTGIWSTVSEKALRTGEVPDWSTGFAAEPSPHRGAFFRKTAARSVRCTLVPATEEFTITTKESVASAVPTMATTRPAAARSGRGEA